METGISTTIAERLSLISSYIPNNSNFFLINGDTIFSFDISGMLKHHIEYKALLTLTSVSVISPFGLIVEENGKITDFRRESSISHMGLADGKNDGYVNGGLSWINKKAFKYIDLKNCYNFEHELFPILIKLNCVEKYALEGTWIPIDTSKDVQTLNQQHESEYNQVKSLKKLKKTLAKNNTLKETP